MVSTIRKQTLLLAAACSAAAALAAAGFILDNRRVDAGEVTVRISTLPAGLDGLRIAHLSDLHYPKWRAFGRRRWRNWLKVWSRT